MSGTASYVSRWAVEDGSTAFSGTSRRLAVRNDTINQSQPLLSNRGMRGIRSAQVEDFRAGVRTVGGDLALDATPWNTCWSLARAIGGTTAAPVMADAVAEWRLLQDRGGEIFRYDGLKINRWALSSSAGGLMELNLSVLGRTCTRNQTWSSGSTIGSATANENAPYQHAELVLTLFAISVPVEQLSLTVDNKLEAKHRNNLDPQVLLEGMREVKLSGTAIFTAAQATALYGKGETPSTGASLVLNGVNDEDTTLSFTRVLLPFATPAINGAEITLGFEATVVGTGNGAEFTVTTSVT